MNDIEVINLIGQDTLKKLESTLQKAYSYGELFIQENPFLQEESAESFRQNIINLSIDYSLAKASTDKLIESGYRYVKNYAKNCKHIELIHNGFIITHSSVNNGNRFPRNAIFRRDLSSTNQMSLYKDDSLVSPCYGILTHRPREIGNRKALVCFGIPDSDYGYWCNKLNLTELNSDCTVTVIEKEYEDFKFELRRKENEHQA